MPDAATLPVRARTRSGVVDRRWGLILVAICVVALGIRVGYVIGWKQVDEIGGDAYYYHRGANLLADGKGFVHPFSFDNGISLPGADHPPGYLVALAIPSLVGLDTILDHQLFSCLLGVGTVALLGFAGRRLAGNRAGLIAAGLGALYPCIWMNDASVMSETLALLCGVVVIIAAYRAWDEPSGRRFAAVGAAIGLASLARAEALTLVVLLAVPLAVWAPRLAGARQRLGRLALASLVAGVVIAPWVVANLVRFERPVTLSSQLGPTLEAANCDDTYYGPGVGSWSVSCVTDFGDIDRSIVDQRSREHAFEYIGDHADRLPAVLTARLTRTFGVGHVSSQLNFDVYAENRALGLSRVGLGAYYVLAAAAIWGAVTLRRRGVPSFPLTSALVNVAVTALLFYGSTRFRAPAEPAIVLLAAVAVDAVARRRGARRAAAIAP